MNLINILPEIRPYSPEKIKKINKRRATFISESRGDSRKTVTDLPKGK